MSETLMTEAAATTTEGQAASEQATESATGAEQGGQQQQATEGQTTEGQPAEGGEAEGTKTEDEQAKPEGAPEKYEFKAPEGHEFSPEVLGKFSEAAKELNLPQDAAQKMLDKIAPAFAERQANALEAARTQWETDAKADKEYGGNKLTENLAVARKALDTFGTPELRTLLNESGLGNHPEIIRAFYRAGKAISEDTFVGGKPSASNDGAKSLYPNSNLK
jgi:hypothetical protein